MGDRRKCQTYAASPAEPGGLPVMLETDRLRDRVEQLEQLVGVDRSLTQECVGARQRIAMFIENVSFRSSRDDAFCPAAFT